MSIDSDVFDVMSGHAPLTALLGVGSAFRMYPSVIAQGEPMPAARWAGFALVWAGLAVLIVDAIKAGQRKKA